MPLMPPIVAFATVPADLFGVGISGEPCQVLRHRYDYFAFETGGRYKLLFIFDQVYINSLELPTGRCPVGNSGLL